jgi:hypothetical protein
MEPSAFLTDKHLYVTFQDNTALVKGVYVACIFQAWSYDHAAHDQRLPQLRFAHDSWPERFQFQGR